MCGLSGVMFAFLLQILNVLHKNILMCIPTENYLTPYLSYIIRNLQIIH